MTEIGGQTVELDYVRRLNGFCEEMLRDHGDLLERKNIRRKGQLLRAIRLDLDKLAHALVETGNNRAIEVLHAFFGDAGGADAEAIRARLAGDGIYHVGFEIHEPAALVLRGIRHWIEQSRRASGVRIAIDRYLEFPASEAFQRRVGAYAVIIRIWLEVRDRILMLELFDIHRPVDAALAGAPPLTHRSFHPVFAESDSDHRRRLTQLFAQDSIWHYALYVQSPADVDWLHERLGAVTERRPDISLAYGAPVHNRHDCSLHTKAIRVGGPWGPRLELEFVTDVPR
jgi:hypothetical protein